MVAVWRNGKRRDFEAAGANISVVGGKLPPHEGCSPCLGSGFAGVAQLSVRAGSCRPPAAERSSRG